MSKDVIPLYINDVSVFARNLSVALRNTDTPPSHTTMLALIAKSAGFKNHQHLKADAALRPEKAPPILKRAIRVFDSAGRLSRWPNKTQLQGLCLWPIWARFPAHQDLTEKQVNSLIKDALDFEDHVLVRRSLIDHKLATRAKDGSAYRRIEQRPPDIALELLAALRVL